MVGIVSGAAVAQTDVEIAVRSKHEVAAVVIRERLDDERAGLAGHQRKSNRDAGIGDERIGRRPQETRDDGVAGRIGEVDEEAAA